MKQASIFLSLAYLALCSKHHANVHSFQLQYRPQPYRNSLAKVNVGFFNPGDWSDMKPNHDEKDIIVLSSESTLSPIQSAWTKYGMIAYVAHMCAFLPLSLLPTYIQTKLGLLSEVQSNHQALQVGQKCAQTLLRWIPFMDAEVTPFLGDNQPTIWVCNHESMLDTFVLLATDEQLRGKDRRPIKTIYWKGLDANPICRILFHMAGFISVDMADNGNGNPNEYNRASFKRMISDTRDAISDGFDILILPEGQLNPTPEQGLQPILPGAFALSQSSHRPIQMVALYGCHHLWHADERIGMKPVGRDVKIKAFPPIKRALRSVEDFRKAFTAIVGKFASTGQDLSKEEADYWFN